jgi:DNA-directed RNA polymerase specialized sigma24 family protein
MGERKRRLDQIETIWPLVRQAQSGAPLGPKSLKAAKELLVQYQEAIYAYLLGALRDRDAADEVFQEFALKFARRDFHKADPSKGRFRDLIKRSLINLVTNYRKRKQALDCHAAVEASALEVTGRSFRPRASMGRCYGK